MQLNFSGSNSQIFKLIYKLKRQMIQQEHIEALEHPKLKKIQQYVFRYSDKIGEGKFSQVYKGIDESSGQTVAVKVIQLSLLKSQLSRQLLQNQIAILKQMNHPNIIKCLDVITSVNNCYIVLQWCPDGDLQKKLILRKKLMPEEIYKIVYHLYKGLSYLANQGIVHRDIKLANIFIQNGNLKIADFGFATKCQSYFKDISIGSPVYMSPEGLISQVYSLKTDVWALGIVLYELLHGQTPLSKCQTQIEIKQKSMEAVKINPDLPKQIKDFIESCLKVYPQQRLGIKELANTQLIRSVFKMMGDEQIPKHLISTIYSADSTEVSQSSIFSVLPSILSYEEAIGLVHYCRLIYKICKLHPSKILAQWLLGLSHELVVIKMDSKNSQSIKLKQVISQYYNKYSKEYSVDKYGVGIDDVMRQCDNMRKNYQNHNHSVRNHLNILLKENQNLKKSLIVGKLEYFLKNTQIQNYLSKKNQDR